MSETNDKMEKIVSLAKRRGFIFQGSEIYGGFSGTYDFGPNGVELKRNISDFWIQSMRARGDVVMLDSSIFTAPEVWEASGHVSGFNDPLVACLSCHSKLRADHILEEIGVDADEKMSEKDLNKLFEEHKKKIVCPVCGKTNFGKVVQKNLLATSTLGKFSDEDKDVYLRGETAQGIFINFKNVYDSGFNSMPFGIAQIGKVFRNEISPRQFLFRKREFEQMEMQYFVRPENADKAYEEWKNERMNYYIGLGIKESNLRWVQHKNLVFYAKNAWDIEYSYPFGWDEVEGIHNRGNYDLKQHQKFSGVNLSIFDEEKNEHYIPYVIETSAGLDRTILMVLAEFYDEEEVKGKKRVVLRFPSFLAPVKAAILPLMRKDGLPEKAREIFDALKTEFTCTYDETASIGKRYRRQDEIGTPYCITVDYETLEDGAVTVRERDSMEQEKVKIADLAKHLRACL